MNRLFVILLVLFCAGCAKVPYVAKTDLQNDHIKGRVKKLKHYGVWQDRQGNMSIDKGTDSIVIEYNRDGNIVVEEKYIPGVPGYQTRGVYSYDDKGVLRSSKLYAMGGSLIDDTRYMYENGKLVKEDRMTEDSNHYDVSYKYDNYGYPVLSVENYDTVFVKKYIYNNKGHLAKVVVKGDIPRVQKFKYDRAGNLVKEIGFNGETTLYNTYGYPVQSIVRVKAEERGKKKSFYVKFDITYEYDSQMNWTRSVMSNKGDVMSITLRELEYY